MPTDTATRPPKRGVVYHRDLAQGSGDWLEARRGLLTASEMKLIITPTLKAASNENERVHLYSLLAQRAAGYVEAGYTSDDMLRGHEDEIDAKIIYANNYAPIEDCGFITNDHFGFTLGYSPDGLVGDDGQIEIKSRLHKLQVKTIIEHVGKGTIPDDYVIQVQTGLLISGRKWCDFISYSAGLPMVTIRVLPDLKIQTAILEAATLFEGRLAQRYEEFAAIMESDARLIATERRIDREITI